MNAAISFAQHLTFELMAVVGNHFVAVHVGLGARSGLPYNQREVCIQFTRDDRVTSLRDLLSFLCGEDAEVCVGEGRGLFQVAKSMDDFDRHGASRANREILNRSLCLSAPEFVCGDSTGPIVSFSMRVVIGLCLLLLKEDGFACEAASDWPSC